MDSDDDIISDQASITDDSQKGNANEPQQQIQETEEQQLIEAQEEETVVEKPSKDKKRQSKRSQSSTSMLHEPISMHKKSKKDKKQKSSSHKKSKKRKRRNLSESSEPEQQEGEGSQKAKDQNNSSDANISDQNYGSAEEVKSNVCWQEGMSQELHNDTSGGVLNDYHLMAQPRLIVLQENLTTIDVKCLMVPAKSKRARNMQEIQKNKSSEQLTYHEKKRAAELALKEIDHISYQERSQLGAPQPLILHNQIAPDFVKGVMKNLTCPICQEMVQSPVIYRNCLHRFCQQCIETYNRMGKKECPLCRVVIGNRRQLRPDKNIAAMIETLKDNLREIREKEEFESKIILNQVFNQQKKYKELYKKQKRIAANERRKEYGLDELGDEEQEASEEQSHSKSKSEQKKKKSKKDKKDKDKKSKSEHKEVEVVKEEPVEEKKVEQVVKAENKPIEKPCMVGQVTKESVCAEIDYRFKKQDSSFKVPNTIVTLKLCPSQIGNFGQSMLKPKFKFLIHNKMTLVHLAVFVCKLNHCSEEEWINFEFFVCPQAHVISPYMQFTMSKGTMIRPLEFSQKLKKLIEFLNCSKTADLFKLELVYRKRQLPQLYNQLSVIRKIQNGVSVLANEIYERDVYEAMREESLAGQVNFDDEGLMANSSYQTTVDANALQRTIKPERDPVTYALNNRNGGRPNWPGTGMHYQMQKMPVENPEQHPMLIETPELENLFEESKQYCDPEDLLKFMKAACFQRGFKLQAPVLKQNHNYQAIRSVCSRYWNQTPQQARCPFVVMLKRPVGQDNQPFRVIRYRSEHNHELGNKMPRKDLISGLAHQGGEELTSEGYINTRAGDNRLCSKERYNEIYSSNLANKYGLDKDEAELLRYAE